MIAVGAANVPDDNGTPRVFAPGDSVAPYSSDGYRRVFFNSDDTPIIPGDFLSTGGQVRIKPDILAADGISLILPNSDSTLVPIRSGYLCQRCACRGTGSADAGGPAGDYLPGDLAAGLRAGAVDLGPAGVDELAGYGAADVVGALLAVADPGPVRQLALTPAPPALVSVSSVLVTITMLISLS